MTSKKKLIYLKKARWEKKSYKSLHSHIQLIFITLIYKVTYIV